jgi:TRAP-type C4-dicarboxylate transport system substrate-binding protein
MTTHEASGGYYQKNFFQPWVDEVAKRTNGEVQIDIHWNGELAALPDAYDACVNGTVDLAWFIPMMVTDKFPMQDVVAFTSYDKVNYQPARTLWELYKMFPEMQKEYSDVKVLFVGTPFFTALTTTAKTGPITTLEQCQGKKMVGVGKWPGVRGEALGWTMAAMGPQDIYSAFQKGVVDGGPLGTAMIMKDQGWGDVMPYVTRVRTNHSPLGLIVNKSAWDKLSANAQSELEGMTDWMVELHDKFMVQTDKEITAELTKEFGTQYFELSAEEAAKWMAADEPAKKKFVDELNSKGLPGTKLMEEYLKLENQYSTPPAS